uniref:penicillin-binding protein 1A n=1 Tax=Pseudomonas aeruginosa TaxID=287 RepID=UPI0024468D16
MVITRDGKEEAVTWDSMKWARPFLSNNSMGPMPRQPADVAQAGDQIRVQRQEDGTLRFVQIPAAQSALISLDPKDGAIRSLVGGFSFEQSNYNRAIQAKRQPGSSFKPFIYSAALDNGFTAASLVNDAPIVFVDEYLDKVWRPKNDTNTFLGPIPLREALYKSRNMVSIRVLQGLGIERAISYITKFGFQRDELPRNFSLALGTATVTPMEIAGAWSVFANGGYKVNPYVIERIESRDGQVLYQANPPRVPVEEQVAADAEDAGNPGDPEHPESAEGEGSIEAQQVAAKAQTTFEPTPAERIIDARTAYIMTSMLQDVIKRGTGRRALALKRTDLAGKTGTTNDSKDGWFSGYNSDYVTSVWVGFDQPETLGRREYGGTVALPIWIRYMGFALKDKPM